MFDFLKNYYEANPSLFTVTIAIGIASIVLGLIVVLAYRAVRKKRYNDELNRQSIENMRERVDISVDDVIDIPDDLPEDAATEDDNANEDPVEPEAEENKVEAQAKTENKPADEKAEAKKEASYSDASPAKEKDESLKKTETASSVKEEPQTTERDKREELSVGDASKKSAATANKTDENTKSAAANKADENTKSAAVKSRYSGKWLITEEGGRYVATLLASNGEVLLRSESYSALSGVKSGIETINNNIRKNNFALSIDKKGKYFFKLYSSATRLLCISEVYKTRAMCERAIESVKRFSQTAVIVVDKKDGSQQ